jgi:hypothetical protein
MIHYLKQDVTSTVAERSLLLVVGQPLRLGRQEDASLSSIFNKHSKLTFITLSFITI